MLEAQQFENRVPRSTLLAVGKIKSLLLITSYQLSEGIHFFISIMQNIFLEAILSGTLYITL